MEANAANNNDDLLQAISADGTEFLAQGDKINKNDFLNLLEDCGYDYKADPAKNHLINVQSLIASKNVYTIPFTVCCEDSLKSDVFWDITTDICKQFSQELFTDNEELFDVFEKCLTYLVTEGNQKEVFYVLIEEIRGVTEQVVYGILVEHAGNVVKKMTAKQRGLSCETLLGAASVFVNSLELPKANLNLEGDERKIVAYDPKVHSVSDALEVYLKVIAVFVDTEKCDGDCSNEIILRRLFDVFDKQLVLIYVAYGDGPKNKSTGYCDFIAEMLLANLAKLFPDFYKLFCEIGLKNERINFEKTIVSDDSVEEHDKQTLVSDISIGCFLYFVIGESLRPDNWPSILSHVNLFQSSIKYIIALLKRTEDLILYKGIYLMEAIVMKFPRDAIHESLLEDVQFTEIATVLISVMIHCTVVEYRQRSLKLLQDYIHRFNHVGRYKLYHHIINNSTHAGVIGHTVTLIKQDVDIALNQTTPNTHFTGDRLEKLLIPALDLPDGVTTDLLTESDRIVADLNLLRYLAIRDNPDTDKSGFWARVDKIEELFLEPLKNGLQHSRANYKMELAQAVENKKQSRRTKEADVEVTVGGMTIPPMLQGKRLEIIEGALGMFDLIESLHGRVMELIESKKRDVKM